MSNDDYGGFVLLSVGVPVTGRFCCISVLNTSTISWVGASSAYANGTSVAVSPPCKIEGFFTSVTLVSGGTVLAYFA